MREQNNIKQEKIAKILDISLGNYNKKEGGKIRFSLIEAKKIADYFGTTIEEIFFENYVSKMETKLKETG
nr:helix-turn-helix transcriptional regulator [Clostridium sp.]